MTILADDRTGTDKQYIQDSDLEVHNRKIDDSNLKPDTFNHGQYKPSKIKKGSKVPFGMSILVYSAVLTLLTAMIVGAVVGGAVYASLHKNKQSSCDSTSSPIMTNGTTYNATSSILPAQPVSDYKPLPPNLVANLSDTCDTITNLASSQPTIDKVWCNTDIPNGNLGWIWAYTFIDCWDACMNSQNNSCQGVAFRSDMNNTVNWDANCWLKNDYTTSNVPGTVSVLRLLS